jgi:hypothetical protein
VSVIVNGDTHPLPEPPLLAALRRSLSPAVPFVVARNDEVAPSGASGRNAFLAGPTIVQDVAVPSTPEIGRPFRSASPQSP